MIAFRNERGEAEGVLRETRDRGGRCSFGAYEVSEFDGFDREGWQWRCACGVGGFWRGNWSGALLVLVAFLNRHEVCQQLVIAARRADPARSFLEIAAATFIAARAR